MNITEKQDATIRALKSHMFHGEFDVVDQLMARYDQDVQDPGRRALFTKLCSNTSGLFAFQSLSANRDDILMRAAQRHSKMLSLWSLPDQLYLCHYEIDTITPHVLDQLVLPKDGVLDAESTTQALGVASKLLQQDNFMALDKLCSQLGLSLTSPMDKSFLYYSRVKGAAGGLLSGAFTVGFSRPYPLFSSALFNLSLKKLNYLTDRGITLEHLAGQSSIFHEKVDHHPQVFDCVGPQLAQSEALLTKLVLESSLSDTGSLRPPRAM